MTIRPRGIGHIGLMARDLEAFVSFYEQVLGMQVSDRMPFSEDFPYYEGVWLRCKYAIPELIRSGTAVSGGGGACRAVSSRSQPTTSPCRPSARSRSTWS